MTDQRLGPALESWLKASDAPPSDVGRSTALIEARLARTPQRGASWSLPALDRLRGPSAGHDPTWRSTMFSAVKLVAAGAIVALFGGFLLAGVLPTQPPEEVVPAAMTDVASPSSEPTDLATTEPESTEAPSELESGGPGASRTCLDCLPGVALSVVEVGPDVSRVVSDGIRDVGSIDGELISGLDGSLWFKAGDTLLQLGADQPIRVPMADGVWVDPDGTVWVNGTTRSDVQRRDRQALSSFDGDKWRQRLVADDNHWEDPIEVSFSGDGAVWALSPTDKQGRYRLQRLVGNKWQTMPPPPAPKGKKDRVIAIWTAKEDGTGRDSVAWVVRAGSLYYLDGRRWMKVAELDRTGYRDITVDEDGDEIFILHEPGDSGHPLIRRLSRGFYGGTWEDVDVPPIPDVDEAALERRVYELDGWSLWMSLETAASRPGCEQLFEERGFGAPEECGVRYPVRCDGLARFDIEGGTWSRYLPDTCVSDIAPGEWGQVWVTAATASPGEVLPAMPDTEAAAAGEDLTTLDIGPKERYVVRSWQEDEWP